MDGATALSILSSLVTIFSRIGMGPVITIFLVIVIGPWIFSLSLAWIQGKRFDAMKDMYSNNVKLVQCYEQMAKAQGDTITLNTAKWSEVDAKIDSNQFCPMIRVKKVRVEDV